MRANSHFLIRAIVLLLFAGPAAVVCSGGEEIGRARAIPWSGYWWPHRQGKMLVPLSKYDSIADRRAADWERLHYPSGPTVPAWHGYCHAWAASAVREVEPNKARCRQSPVGAEVEFRVGDQKGLLAACHTSDVANTYGDRYGDNAGSEDKQDLAPDTLWYLLKLYVKQRGVPLILDIEAGPQVWNYPVYAYEVKHLPSGDRGEQSCQLALSMADNGVPPDYVGVKVRRQTYQFTCRIRNGSIVMGSGRWVGRSLEDHPDFAWYPFVAVAENPEMNYATVRQIISKPDEPPPADTPPEDPEEQPADATPEPPRTEPEVQPPTVTTPEPPDAEPEAVVISPMELVALIAGRTSSFGLDVKVDRFDGGTYKVGETFFIEGSSERPGYLYLLHLDGRGELTLLYPLPGRPASVRVPGDRAGGHQPCQGIGHVASAGANRLAGVLPGRGFAIPTARRGGSQSPTLPLAPHSTQADPAALAAVPAAPVAPGRGT